MRLLGPFRRAAARIGVLFGLRERYRPELHYLRGKESGKATAPRPRKRKATAKPRKKASNKDHKPA